MLRPQQVSAITDFLKILHQGRLLQHKTALETQYTYRYMYHNSRYFNALTLTVVHMYVGRSNGPAIRQLALV